ncbi:shikimate kinase [Thermaurantiacus tibetensis]|uniref:shikimate kinase n=1 Tax=Thermaurantiacus tibetensis TaxID=2759035 RepID=UPI00188E72AF|nr:shikimate kinase [Thermaurantiacus tibetensis]
MATERAAATGPAGAVRRPLVLVGMPGSGKSAIGRRLAAALDLPFVDSDAEIEAAAQMSISEIFARFGEPHFRDGERRVIARLLDGTPRVIATGGGAFQDPDTRALALARGFVVWLDADLDTLVARVGRRDHRPLLAGRDARAVLAALLAERAPAYRQAHLRVVSGDAPHEATVAAILAALTGQEMVP